MPGKKTAHMYSPDFVDSLRGIPLPKKIKCGRCSKNFGQTKYSTKQLTDARFYIKNYGAITKPINCMTCTGPRVVEVECTMCGKTKGLEEFAKSQRNKPDTAKCFKCMDDQVNDKPIDDEKYNDPNKAFVTPDHSNGNYPEYWSSATTSTGSSYDEDEWRSVNGDANNKRVDSEDGGILLSRQVATLSMTGSISDDHVDTEYAYPAGDRNQDDNDGWHEVRSSTKSWHTKSNGALSASSGFDRSAYSNPSAISMTGTARSFASSEAERSNVSDIRNNECAKLQTAHPSLPSVSTHGGPVVPMGDDVREHDDAWKPDSDEEEESDVDDDDDSDDDTII